MFFCGVVDTTIHCHRCVVIVAVVVVSQLWGHMNCLFHLASSIPYPLAVVSCHFGLAKCEQELWKLHKRNARTQKHFVNCLENWNNFDVFLLTDHKNREIKTKEPNKTYKHDNNEGQMSFDATKTTHIHTYTHTHIAHVSLSVSRYPRSRRCCRWLRDDEGREWQILN